MILDTTDSEAVVLVERNGAGVFGKNIAVGHSNPNAE